MMEHGNKTAPLLTPEERRKAAMSIWNHEKGMAAAVIIFSWIFKVCRFRVYRFFFLLTHCLQIYFALIIYSYAIHLRKGSYRLLPLSRPLQTPYTASHATTYDALARVEDEDEDFYRIPLRSPPLRGHRHGTNNNSLTSLADFVSAPGRPPRKKASGGANGHQKENGLGTAEVLFDEDEATYAASASSRGHSKLGTGTDSSTVATSDEEHAVSSRYGI